MDRSEVGIARCIRLAREGQQEALNELLEAHRNYLRVLAASCLHHEMQGKADPSDIVQDTLLKVHQSFRHFRGTTELEWMAWLRQVLVNHLNDFQKGHRRERRNVAREQPLESLVDRSSAMLRNLGPAPGPSPSQEAQRREAAALVADASRAGLEHGRRADRAVARRGAHALGPGDAARGRIAQREVVVTDKEDFAKILDEYLRALEAGNPPDREALLARHPELEEELKAALLGIDFVHVAAPRLAPEEHADALPGRSLGDYRLLRELGRGGMAVVYEAEQVSLARRVALKVLPFAAVLDPKQLQRFKNEALAAAHLRHPNIVPVYGVGCDRGVHFYAMQYVDGQSLAMAIRDMKSGSAGEEPKSPISSHGSNREPAYIRMAAALGVQAAEALDHAHQLGIVHRDVKPGNLLADLAGTLWVTDFGLASSIKDVSLTITGELLGTLRYMSPEQALAKRAPVDHRTDVYSLGATLYELLTLEPAFPGDDPHRVIQDIALKEPVLPRRLNPALPRDLETVLLKALWKDPVGRYATAQEMADDLMRLLENQPIEAKRPGLFRRASMWSRRHRTLVAAAVVLLLLSTVGLATGTALLWREQAETESALDSSEANLNLALMALDQIYVDEAEGHPKIREGLPHDLLKRGLGFYQEFARENAHNQRVAFSMGRAHYRASLIFRELRQEDQAKEALERAISNNREAIWLKPDFAAAHSNLSTALLDKGDLDGAIASARKALRLEPDSADAHCGLGCVLRANGNMDGAIREFRETIRLNPDYVDGHGILGSALLAKGDPDSAIASFREAIRLQPNLAKAHCALGDALLAKGDPDSAIASCREAIRLKPDFAEAHNNLGRALSRKGDPDGAIASYREAIRLEPDYAKAHGSLGNVHFAKGDLDGAIALFRESIRLNPGDARVHNNLGLALAGTGDADGAIASYREAIRLDPGDFTPHFNLGNALRHEGDPDGAIAEYRGAIRLEPDHAEAHGNLGGLLFAKGDTDGAIAEYREFIRLEPGDAQAHCNRVPRARSSCPGISTDRRGAACRSSGR
jgi:RNA polymerase sigma-70 factor (subfamily 1)